MKDQCDKLRDMGVAACQLNSAVAAAELAEAEGAVRDGSAKIAFTTPERLADPTFLELVSGQRVSLLVVDEVPLHFPVGHDFRPAFLEIGQAFRAPGPAAAPYPDGQPRPHRSSMTSPATGRRPLRDRQPPAPTGRTCTTG
jgi:superfamily II DNA helicase RecQ